MWTCGEEGVGPAGEMRGRGEGLTAGRGNCIFMVGRNANEKEDKQGHG